jgi:hypothetical protein
MLQSRVGWPRRNRSLQRGNANEPIVPKGHDQFFQLPGTTNLEYAYRVPHRNMNTRYQY